MTGAMDERPPEQSMEDILASIKRVISADAAAARRLPSPARDDVLELGEAPGLVSDRARYASKAALATLATVQIDAHAPPNTLDGLVREMLRPMLKQWLDDNLPELVERVVAREVARIVGR